MHVVNPAVIAKWSLERLEEGYLQNRLAILEHALQSAGKVPSTECVRSAAEFLQEQTDITLTSAELLSLLDLYPYAKAKLADYGWGDTEVGDLILDVIAHAYLGSRWPMNGDGCDTEVFLDRLRHARKSYMRLVQAA